ncbi:hypothetical protein ADK60_27235 [Streptomyces sp. XY431]|uniref:hypothetical protein n=1 Tax=Streptomyces sp. XY431 TaxID=1415562 RepID=UPI0006C0E813|nr:hypothetical protein [Streptomyces sp. XY431]KOV17638.1 hypothetical protein ADK60_27235 [Streptomyces sp. XY431]
MSEEPKFVLLALTVSSEGSERLRLDPADTGLLTNPVVFKEGAEYSLGVEFRVNPGDISRYTYVHLVKRAGVKVDKLEGTLGSYGPSPEGRPYKKELTTEEMPEGVLARSGTYAVQSRILDDDGTVYADFKWSYKIAADWR